MPLLNAKQVVASWREILPRLRDAEVRRIPLELPGPGVYLVEAVTTRCAPTRSLMVSDVALVTKAAPGQMLLFAADRSTGEPAAECERARRSSIRHAVGTASPRADGVVDAALPETSARRRSGHWSRCGDQVGREPIPAATVLQPTAAVNWSAYVYTDRPIYRPGHTVQAKAVLRWRAGRCPGRLRSRRTVEMVVTDPTETVIHRAQRRDVDEFGARAHRGAAAGAGAALGVYSVRS